MTFEFDFTPDNTRDCVLETENRLRDLIDSVLKRKYGTAWEDDPKIGWNKNKKTELENRRKEKKAKFPHQRLSQRLIDYSYIGNLKDLVSKNQDLFKSIFSSWDETLIMLDLLAKFRNNVLHHQNEILKHQHYLCIGICGEFLLAIHNWKTKYSREIESYHCDFRFEELEGENPDAAKTHCLEKAEIWVRSIKDNAIKEITIEQDSSYGQIYKLQLREGEICISSPIISRRYYGVYTQSANVHLMSKSKNAIDQILERGNPY